MVFDLQNATKTTISGNTYLDLPMYIISSGGISSFDFWFQFDEAKMTYDSTIVVVAALDALSNFNANNHNLSNTTSGPDLSYQVPGNTTLLKLRFLLANNNTVVDTSDFSGVNTLFNGNPCNYKFTFGTSGSGAGLVELLSNQVNWGNAFPNPTSDQLQVMVNENASVELFDLSGKVIIEKFNILAESTQSLNLKDQDAGIYLLKVETKKYSVTNFITLVK